MTKHHYVRTVEIETEAETVDGPFGSASAGIDHAEQLARGFFGADVTWFEHVGGGRYHVGRMHEDGSRSDPLVTITVEEQDIDEAKGIDSA